MSCGNGTRSRNARAAAYSCRLARCVRSPLTATRCGLAAVRAASNPSTAAGSSVPKCKSEMCAIRRMSGGQHLQCRGDDFVLQRRVEVDDLAVDRHRQPALGRIHDDLFQHELTEVAGLPEPAEERE